MPVPLTMAYSVPAGMTLVFFSGLTAKDSESITVGVGDVASQAEHILDAIDDALRSAGGDLSHVIKLTIFLQNRSDAAAVGKVRARRFADGSPPASTMLVGGLLSEDQLIEIEAVAALPS
jgi:enamine deaminase RidA (YjgF/YER057c/UK114 family)